MALWQSYELVDFLMFSPDIYFRMVANHVAWSWPLAVLYASGLLGALVLWRKTGEGRPMGIALAAGWLLPTWLFLFLRYSDIMTAAPTLAALVGAQAIVLAVLMFRPVPVPAGAAGPGRYIGWGLVVVAFLYPLVAPLAGRGWGPVEPLGLMPDPVVVLTAGWFVLTGERRLIAWVIPCLWAIVSSLTLHTMGEPDYWLLPVLVGSGIVAAFMPEKARKAT